MSEIKDPMYVQPTSDIGFHWIFCTEGNDEVVLQLLNILIDDKEIVSFVRLDPEHVVNADTRFTFDLYCKCADGSRIIVECQNKSKRERFMNRALAYSAMAINDQLRPKMKYEYSKVYFIGLLNYDQFKHRKEPITKVRLYTEDHVLANDNYLQIFVELRKLPKKSGDDFPTVFLKALRDLGQTEKQDEGFKDERLQALLKAASFPSMPKQQQQDYKEYMTTEQDVREYWEEQVSDAREEGFAEGMAQGEAKGKAEGMMEVARAMKAEGMETSLIVKLTGLEADKINALLPSAR